MKDGWIIVTALGTFVMALATFFLGSKANEIAVKSNEIIRLSTDEPLVAICGKETNASFSRTSTYVLRNSRKFKEYNTRSYLAVGAVKSTLAIQDTGRVAAMPLRGFPAVTLRITVESPLAVREVCVRGLDTTSWGVTSNIIQDERNTAIQILKVNLMEPLLTTEKRYIEMLWAIPKVDENKLKELANDQEATDYMREKFKVEVWSPQSRHSYLSIWP